MGSPALTPHPRHRAVYPRPLQPAAVTNPTNSWVLVEAASLGKRTQCSVDPVMASIEL